MGPIGPVGPVGPSGSIGLQGPVGLQGPTGPTGSNGPRGIKTVLWNGSVDILEDTETTVCTIPYDGSTYSLSNIDIVASGKGLLKVSIVSVDVEQPISTNEFDLVDERIQVLSINNFVSIDKKTVLLIKMSIDNTNNNNRANITSIEFGM